MTKSPLQRLLTTLGKRYGRPEPSGAGPDALALILWEMVAYLADDETRAVAFAALRDQVGLAPSAITAAPLSVLTTICRLGGPVQPRQRAQRIKLIAALVTDDFGGDLSKVLKLEYIKAVRALRRFPSVGEPGADRILMLCHSHAVLGLDSNALRVLCRLGYTEESKNYTRMYRQGRDAAAAELPRSAARMAEASLLLREHGKTTCKYTVPRCDECVISAGCKWYRTHPV